MNWPADASNWLDVFDHFVVVVGAIVLAAVPGWVAARRNYKAIKEVSDSVNNRPTALRDDLDRALMAIQALGEDIHALRGDLLTERQARKAQVDDLRDDVDRMRRR